MLALSRKYYCLRDAAGLGTCSVEVPDEAAFDRATGGRRRTFALPDRYEPLSVRETSFYEGKLGYQLWHASDPRERRKERRPSSLREQFLVVVVVRRAESPRAESRAPRPPARRRSLDVASRSRGAAARQERARARERRRASLVGVPSSHTHTMLSSVCLLEREKRPSSASCRPRARRETSLRAKVFFLFFQRFSWNARAR